MVSWLHSSLCRSYQNCRFLNLLQRSLRPVSSFSLSCCHGNSKHSRRGVGRGRGEGGGGGREGEGGGRGREGEGGGRGRGSGYVCFFKICVTVSLTVHCLRLVSKYVGTLSMRKYNTSCYVQMMIKLEHVLLCSTSGHARNM